ncbi:MAG: enoyl-CoA hydratase [Candidatus Sedimenticola endophacoides]|uniref:Enoyl-CoA hydratase domain-containing protein 3, mitochondrial n=1 Tax=Candidatus Sedimenticola endophacoides TaxID=2548426 RepID=A0A657PJZ4_9GAMM|nr:MAG: enoyl-CoA hydratase [Candidatus Sedimenticola endophacoides]
MSDTHHNTEPLLLREDDAGVTTLTLNRPRQYNALSDELIDELQAALDTLAAEPETRVIVLAGSGKAFCAGHDLKQMRAQPERGYYEALFQRCGRIMTTIMAQPQPVIARVHGIATAAGCQLVAACDLAVAADCATFAVSGINVGLFCSTPGVALARNIGRKRALEMLLTGEFIDAAQAQAEGLINRVVPIDRLDVEIYRLAKAIRDKSPLAIRTGKAMFYRQLEMGAADAYAYAAGVMAGNMLAEDAAEGIDAFPQRRPPEWKGR